METQPIPLIDRLVNERTDVVGILTNVEADIARLKSFDESLMTPEGRRRHAKSIANAVAAKGRAQHRLAQLKVEIKNENNRLHAAQQVAARLDRARREAEARGEV